MAQSSIHLFECNGKAHSQFQRKQHHYHGSRFHPVRNGGSNLVSLRVWEEHFDAPVDLS